jgi:hypothetical protein
MPELPDIDVYVECLAERIVGASLQRIGVENPFLLRSVEPSAAELESRAVIGVRRLGKRIAIELDAQHCRKPGSDIDDASPLCPVEAVPDDLSGPGFSQQWALAVSTSETLHGFWTRRRCDWSPRS